MSRKNLAERYAVGNQDPDSMPATERPETDVARADTIPAPPPNCEAPPVSLVRVAPVRSVIVDATSEGFGFGWSFDGPPSLLCDGLTPHAVLTEYRHAWRRHNGTHWRWVMAFRGSVIMGDRDDLLEGLDDLAEGALTALELLVSDTRLSP